VNQPTAEENEMDDNKLYAWAWAIVGACIITGAICVTTYWLDSNRRFVDGGYCQTSVPGVNGAVWTKCAK
jgi:hypothetical protein